MRSWGRKVTQFLSSTRTEQRQSLGLQRREAASIQTALPDEWVRRLHRDEALVHDLAETLDRGLRLRLVARIEVGTANHLDVGVKGDPVGVVVEFQPQSACSFSRSCFTQETETPVPDFEARRILPESLAVVP